MPLYPPKWVLRRLKGLWDGFGNKEFTFEQAQNSLGDDSRIVALVLSRLKNMGWVEIRQNTEDPRKKIYKILHPETVGAMEKIEV